MRRYINQDAVIEMLWDLVELKNAYDMKKQAVEIVQNWEPSDVRENVRGEWIDFSMSIKGVPTEACGVCGEWSLGMGKNYCPNCGADMRGGNE